MGADSGVGSRMVQQVMMDLLEKYSKVRAKFFKSFIAVGDPAQPGTNLPAVSRHAFYRGSSIMTWGDTTIVLGEYIAFLATEFKRLELDGENGTDSLVKLYLALLSLHRLDETAERYYRENGTVVVNDVNGFFIRDDVDSSFLERNPDLKSWEFGPVDQVRTDFTSTSETLKEMSQDQCWSLLLGLSLTVKLFEDRLYTIQFNEDSVPFNPHRLAKTLTSRIIGYMSSGGWEIVNPVTGVPVARGSDVSLNAWAFVECHNFICGKGSLPNLSKNLPTFSKLTYLAAFHLSNFLYTKLLPRSKWLRDRIPVKDYSFSILNAIGSLVKGTMRHLEENVTVRDNYSHLPLLHKLLYPSAELTIPKEWYEEFLGQSAVHNYKYGEDSSNHRWSATDNLFNSDCRGSANWLNGYYSGLDYLLLYNLYRLVYPPAK